MTERGRFNRAIRKVKREGFSAVVGAAMSISICPVDDIAAMGASIFTGSAEVTVHQGVMPVEGNFKAKKPGTSLRGTKIQ